MSYNVIIPQIQDEELMCDINELAEYFLGKKLNPESNVPNPFGSKDKIVLELETAKDGTKKLTHESEVILGAMFDEKSTIIKNMSKHLLAYMAQNATNNMAVVATKKQLFWIASRLYGAIISYDDTKKVYDDAFELSKKIQKLQEVEDKLVSEEHDISKILIQFMLALEDTEILAKIKKVLGKIILQDDDLKAQWEAVKAIPDPIAPQANKTPDPTQQENIVKQIIAVNVAQEENKTKSSELEKPEQEAKSSHKNGRSKRIELNATNQQTVETLVQSS